MKEPKFLLENETKVRTHKVLNSVNGIIVSMHHIEARKADRVGTIKGVVSGHGGDIYWVHHEGDPMLDPAVYCWTEFELVE